MKSVISFRMEYEPPARVRNHIFREALEKLGGDVSEILSSQHELEEALICEIGSDEFSDLLSWESDVVLWRLSKFYTKDCWKHLEEF